jgi:hypothetical protein
MKSEDWTAGFPLDADWPQTLHEDPPGYHEAIWTFGHDPKIGVGYWLYLLNDLQEEGLKHERIVLYLPDGSLLRGIAQGRNSHGRTSAAAGLENECVEPFHRWTTRYAGALTPAAWNDAAPQGAPVDVTFEFDMIARTPAWNVEGDWGERPPNMRFHQMYELSRGEIAIAGRKTALGGTCMRGHSRRTRSNADYNGHIVVNALFESGKAFGTFCFFGKGVELSNAHGYVYMDGKRHEALLVSPPPLVTRFRPEGDELRLVFEGSFGQVEITGRTISNCVTPTQGGGKGLVTTKGLVRYEWDGEVAYGQLELWHTSDVVEMS